MGAWPGWGVVLIALYIGAIIGPIIYVLVLLARFVRAHQRGADALESIAEQMRGQQAPE